MKKLFLIACFLVILPSVNAFASFVPGWQRPLMRAEMAVRNSQSQFLTVKAVTVTLTHTDGNPMKGPTGISLEYNLNQEDPQGNKNIVMDLVINKREKDAT